MAILMNSIPRSQWPKSLLTYLFPDTSDSLNSIDQPGLDSSEIDTTYRTVFFQEKADSLLIVKFIDAWGQASYFKVLWLDNKASFFYKDNVSQKMMDLESKKLTEESMFRAFNKLSKQGQVFDSTKTYIGPQLIKNALSTKLIDSLRVSILSYKTEYSPGRNYFDGAGYEFTFANCNAGKSKSLWLWIPDQHFPKYSILKSLFIKAVLSINDSLLENYFPPCGWEKDRQKNSSTQQFIKLSKPHTRIKTPRPIRNIKIPDKVLQHHTRACRKRVFVFVNQLF